MSAIFGTNSLPQSDIYAPTALVAVKFSGGVAIPDSWALVDISLGSSEITDIRKCFSDVTHIYAFGNDQNQCVSSFTFMNFLGAKSCGNPDDFKSIASAYAQYVQNRISNHTGTQTMTVGSLCIPGWLTGIRVHGLDATRQTCNVTLMYLMDLEKIKSA